MRTIITIIIALLAAITLTGCTAVTYCPAYDGVRQHPYTDNH